MGKKKAKIKPIRTTKHEVKKQKTKNDGPTTRWVRKALARVIPPLPGGGGCITSVCNRAREPQRKALCALGTINTTSPQKSQGSGTLAMERAGQRGSD